MCGLVSSSLGIMTNAGGIFFSPIAAELGQPTATVNPKNVIDSSVTWSSEDPSIATVSSEGLITAVAPGKTYIYATAHNGKVGKCTITGK